MNSSVSHETLNNPNPGPILGGMSVLERQRAQFRWPEEPGNAYFNEAEQLTGGGFLFGNVDDHGLSELLVERAMKPDPGIETGWNDGLFGELPGFGNGSEFEMRNHLIPRTTSCPPAVAVAMAEVAAARRGKEAGLSSRIENKESVRKRKADKPPNLKVVAQEKSHEKKMKGCVEDNSSKETEQISNSKSSITTVAKDNKKGNSSNENLRENSKGSDAPKPDYIHVRARRGQATDSHSLAERVRREKISERMKYLQDLVPGCNKITGKAGMLDEIINYVQSLQKQVEFLSMKLAAVNPTLDFDIDNYAVKEMQYPACASSIPTVGMSSSTINPVHLQFNALTEGAQCSGLDMGVISPHSDVTLRRTISAPLSLPDAFVDSPCLNQIQSLPWDIESQNLHCMEYQQSTSFINSQPFAGFSGGQVKLEM